MIKNFWKNITVICGNHGENTSIKMDLKQGPSSLFYSCPKYYPENRKPGEKACVNRVNLIDFQKIVEMMSEEIEQAESTGNRICLTNRVFKVRYTEVTVLKHSKEHIVIKLLNKQAIK